MGNVFLGISYLIISLTAAPARQKRGYDFENMRIKYDDSDNSSSTASEEITLPKLACKVDLNIPLVCYYRNSVKKNDINTKDNTIFLFIIKVVGELLNNYQNVSLVINQIYILIGLKKHKCVFELLKCAFDLMKTQYDFSIKTCLEFTPETLKLEPEAKIREKTLKLIFYLTVAHCLSVENDNINFAFLKKTVLEKFPKFKTINKADLKHEYAVHYARIRSCVKEAGIDIADFVPFLDFAIEVLTLSMHINVICKNIPNSYLNEVFNSWGVFGNMKILSLDPFPSFIFILELFFYLFEIDFIPNILIKGHRVETVNLKSVKRVVQAIGVLYYIQINTKVEDQRTLSLQDLKAYIETTYIIANLPENLTLIMINYNSFRQQLKKVIEEGTAINEINNILYQYIYANVSLFCYAGMVKVTQK